MKKLIYLLCATSVAVSPVAASAQLGGLRKLVGGGETKTAAAVDPDTFLEGTVASTKNVMIAAAILAQVVVNKGELASTKAYIDTVRGFSSVKEINAQKAAFASDLEALNSNENLAATVEAAYKGASAEQKELIATALFNFALGILRNVELVDQAPRVLDSIKGNPMLIRRAGQVKLAAELVGLQAKGSVKVVTVMPKLLAAAKVKAPAGADATEPKPVAL